MKCPNCGRDITDEMFSIDSEVNGIINIGYDCKECEIEVYCFFVKYIDDEKEE